MNCVFHLSAQVHFQAAKIQEMSSQEARSPRTVGLTIHHKSHFMAVKMQVPSNCEFHDSAEVAFSSSSSPIVLHRFPTTFRFEILSFSKRFSTVLARWPFSPHRKQVTLLLFRGALVTTGFTRPSLSSLAKHLLLELPNFPQEPHIGVRRTLLPYTVFALM